MPMSCNANPWPAAGRLAWAEGEPPWREIAAVIRQLDQLLASPLEGEEDGPALESELSQLVSALCRIMSTEGERRLGAQPAQGDLGGLLDQLLFCRPDDRQQLRLLLARLYQWLAPRLTLVESAAEMAASSAAGSATGSATGSVAGSAGAG